MADSPRAGRLLFVRINRRTINCLQIFIHLATAAAYRQPAACCQHRGGNNQPIQMIPGGAVTIVSLRANCGVQNAAKFNLE